MGSGTVTRAAGRRLKPKLRLNGAPEDDLAASDEGADEPRSRKLNSTVYWSINLSQFLPYLLWDLCRTGYHGGWE